MLHEFILPRKMPSRAIDLLHALWDTAGGVGSMRCWVGSGGEGGHHQAAGHEGIRDEFNAVPQPVFLLSRPIVASPWERASGVAPASFVRRRWEKGGGCHAGCASSAWRSDKECGACAPGCWSVQSSALSLFACIQNIFLSQDVCTNGNCGFQHLLQLHGWQDICGDPWHPGV